MAAQQANQEADRRKGILLESGTNEVEFLDFVVAGQRFGVNVGKVCQALVWDESQLTPLPGSPPEICGTILFRDHPILVVDLKPALDLAEPAEQNPKPLLLVMEFNQKTTGFVIDRIEGIRRVSWEEFIAIEEVATYEGSNSIIGTITIDQQIVMILDLEAMMGKLDSTMNIESYADDINVAPEQTMRRSEVNIVYSEDSVVIQRVALRLLESAGFTQIKVFPNGARALEYVEQSEPGEIDIIISDIEMPEMDGLTFCKRVKSNSKTAGIPFIFFSSMITDQMRAKCESVGGCLSLSKPEIHRMVEAIDQFSG